MLDKTSEADYVQAIRWADNAIQLLDQRLLPSKEEYVECSSVRQAYNAIKDMVVRGAPAIGITAAYAAALSVHCHQSQEQSKQLILKDFAMLRSARPTAVNLMWAIDLMQELLGKQGDTLSSDAFLELAKSIHKKDILDNENMGKMALSFFKSSTIKPFSVLTHCNAGSLATGGYGTALGAIRAGFKSGMISDVFADETRPWLQGSRLTAWELQKSGIPVTLNSDSSAATILDSGKVKWVIVGADRVAANGDVANKIGTYSLAVLAKFHGVKFMVVAPSSTVDMSTASGAQIEIEHRDASEIIQFKDHTLAPNNVSVYNPVFDVTPANLIDVIVTEKGAVANPNLVRMQELFR